MTVEQRFWSKVDKRPDSCWVWTASKVRGAYGRFKLKGKMRRAHRVAWELTNGPIPEDLCCLHQCDNPACVRPSHLWIGTEQDNMRDRDNKNRQARQQGEQHGAAKLTALEVKQIRNIGHTQTLYETAQQFNVSLSLVGLIIQGKRWKHV